MRLQFMNACCFITTFIYLFGLCKARKDTEKISNPVKTNLGKWGLIDFCPTDTSFVVGISVKIQKYLGVWKDDTGLNGVRLHCSEFEDIVKAQMTEPLPTNQLFHKNNTLISKHGPWGKWKDWEFCHNGLAIGFEVRSLKWDDGMLADNTAADDMRLLCSGSESQDKPKYAGNGALKGNFGDWTGPRYCKAGYAVCGLQTQVEDPQGEMKGFFARLGMDYTALNNVNLYCCPLPEVKCNATLRWEEFLLDWTQSPVEGKYSFKVKTSVSDSRTTQSSVFSSTTMKVSVSGNLPVLSKSFGIEADWGHVSEDAWSEILTKTITNEEEVGYEITIKPNCHVTIYRVIGECDQITIRTKRITPVYKCSENPQVSRLEKRSSDNNNPHDGSWKKCGSYAFLSTALVCCVILNYILGI